MTHDAPPTPDLYEKLGAFYLGRPYDLETDETAPAPLLYDARDLTTHAMCVGMTGSGKTGLCVSLLEEALIDGVPALIVDPKGDLGNLLLTFPDLAPEDFRPWVDPDAARRKNLSVDEYAAKEATKWRDGLASWGQGPERLQRLRESAEFRLYTPGSTAGLPVSVLASLEAPPPEVRADPEVLGDRIHGVVSGLLGLLEIDADPLTSREHVLLSAILDHVWKEGRGLDLGGLVQAVQSPPVSRVGVMEVESFFPSKERFELALQLNHLLAAPGFQAWLSGEPLDVDRLLYGAEGKPRVSIFSLNHLSDAERMFFVSLLLGQVLAWMRGRPGTGSLRALLYMDEVMGYLPPVAEPPSKRALLTLLKQARAFGLGLVLATQNPADLDYKALSNMGTWFLGRLQTERDRKRVMDGLLSAAPDALDRKELESILSGLPSRVFFLHNVHEETPVVFHTRWAMSYLKGPLTRPEISRLTEGMGSEASAAPSATPTDAATAPTESKTSPVAPPASSRPVLPPEIPQAFLAGASEGADLKPYLLGEGRVGFVDKKHDVEAEEAVYWVHPLAPDGEIRWEDAKLLDEEPELAAEPPANAGFAELPSPAARESSYRDWTKSLSDALYHERRLELAESPTYGAVSRPGESERDFRIRLRDLARERRDEAVDELRESYGKKLDRLEEKQRKTLQKIDKEQDQARHQKLQTALSFGTTLLSAFMGRKIQRRTGTALRGVSRSFKEGRDVERAREDLEALEAEERELSAELEREIRETEERFDPLTEELTTYEIRPRRADVRDERVRLVWAPPGVW